MKLFKLVTLLSLNGLVSAACFWSGQEWDGWHKFIQAGLREDICKPKVLSGDYIENEIKEKCLALGDGVHAKFSITRLNKSASLSDYDCYFYMNRELEECARGGETTYGNWRFR